MNTPAQENALAFSPNGKWLAYVSDESGQGEVYVRPLPGPGGKSKVSTDGGTEPVWARNGRELFYRSGDRMMVVSIRADSALLSARRRCLPAGILSAISVLRMTSQPMGKDS